MATVFIHVWTLIYTFYSQGAGIIRETKLPMQELELKVPGRGLIYNSRGVYYCGVLPTEYVLL